MTTSTPQNRPRREQLTNSDLSKSLGYRLRRECTVADGCGYALAHGATNVADGIDHRQRGLLSRVTSYVTLLVKGEASFEEFRIWAHPDSNKDSACGNSALLSGPVVFDDHMRDLGFTANRL